MTVLKCNDGDALKSLASQDAHLVLAWCDRSERTRTHVGRLAFAAALRHWHRGTYDHPALTRVTRLDARQRDAVLRRRHEDCFAAWFGSTFAAQTRDLRKYLSQLDEDAAVVVARWQRMESYRMFAPESVSKLDRELYSRNMQALLGNALPRGPRSVEIFSTAPSSDARIIKAVEYATECQGDPRLTLLQVAQKLELSSHYLGMLFKKELGTSFRGYLRSLRMRRASELLKTSGLGVAAIAELCGYQDSSNFCHDFRAYYGRTPGAWRGAETSDPLSSHELSDADLAQAAGGYTET